MTTKTKKARRKLSLLQLAAELTNVSKACTPDLVKLAEAYGGRGIDVTSSVDLEAILTSGFAENVPVIFNMNVTM
jgi:thiamine pyrophosphate-dependent acetolactate synthase large subunit-like protein